MPDTRQLPKVLLHDHLDGGVRPATVLELAETSGYQALPSRDLAELTQWFYQGDSSSLERYLEAFSHTFGVMQDAASVSRVAYEAAEDLAAENVVYAEIRFGPSLHLAGGMTRAEVIEAVLVGTTAAEHDTGITVRLIIDALRHETDSVEVTTAALEFVDHGVVGFDLAGPEAGFPPVMHRAALALASEGGLHLTIHAGEGDGVDSIAGALAEGAERIGHGARIIEDTTVSDGKIVDMGPVATEIHERGIPLELCPTSNLHTGMYTDADSHPIGMLHRAGFAVTLNTDNRLMSGITPSDEFDLVTAHHGFEVSDFERVTLQAVESAFCDDETRDRIRSAVSAGYAS